MQIIKIAELKRSIADAILDYEGKDFPMEFWFNEGMEFPDFKITIDRVEKNYFIDSTGRKWVKVDDD